MSPSQSPTTLAPTTKDIMKNGDLYLYLCLGYSVPALLSFLPQICSPISRWISSISNPCFSSILQLFYPLHSLYVGRDTYAGPGRYLQYSVFWLSLLGFKLWFSYEFQIYPLMAPTHTILSSTKMTVAIKVALVFCVWIPVLFIYFIDLQIWYFVWYSVVGLVRGWSQHLGEIRGLTMLRDRFLSVPEMFNKKMLPLRQAKPSGAVVAVPSPSTRQPEARQALLAESRQQHAADAKGHRLEYWQKFGNVWNKLVRGLREDDLISDREAELQRFRFAQSPDGGLEVYLPIFITAGLLDKTVAGAMSIAKRCVALMDLQGGESERMRRTVTQLEKDFHTKVSRSMLQIESVSETWESICWVLVSLLGPFHRDDVLKIITVLVKLSKDRSLLWNLSLIHVGDAKFKLLKLTQTIENALKNCPDTGTDREPPAVLRGALNGVVGSLREVLETLLKIVSKGQDELRNRIETIKFARKGFFWDDNYAIEQLIVMRVDSRTLPLLRRLCNLLTAAKYDVEPRNPDARRRLRFFVNSMFMDIPKATAIHESCSWSTMTPYYSETILNSKKELLEVNEDGVSTLYYLRTLYPQEWTNFCERIKGKSEAEILNDPKKLLELRMWAANRGQTLYRTVRGMMQYERALRLICDLQGVPEVETEEIVRAKFSYVVSCQRFGAQKQAGQQNAADAELLLMLYPNLRIAYIDEVKVPRTDGRGDTSTFFSVLVKFTSDVEAEMKGRQTSRKFLFNTAGGKIEEVYRIQLPCNPIIGEGKPENQNHAVIFTRGEALQVIDMNQDNAFEDAVKFPNLLQEFHAGCGEKPTIIGIREHIFTGSLNSLAKFMALQESAFVTIGQRVLHWPLSVRMHYGHPDVFWKLFCMTRGGVSKASKGINLSEDIFAGFNTYLRGGHVTMHEYLQLGKGRDVGLQQITLFEAKLAQGNAEQVISRDVYRLAHSFDFFRLLSFYYGGSGFYINTYLTVMFVYIYLYCRLVLVFPEIHKAITDAGATWSQSLFQTVNAEAILQMGFLMSLPLLAYIGLEKGFRNAFYDFIVMLCTGSPLFFTFHLGTKTHYFDRTIMFGGAKYRATGRGFVIRHETFAELFRFYATSHFYKALELLAVLAVYYVCANYSLEYANIGVVTWAMWFVAFCWFFTPFWFNPLAFDFSKTLQDFEEWSEWMKREDLLANRSWKTWWKEEKAYLEQATIGQKLSEMLFNLRWLLLSYGLACNSKIELVQGITSKEEAAGIYLGGLVALCILILLLLKGLWVLKLYRLFRGAKVLIFMMVTIVLIILLLRYIHFRDFVLYMFSFFFLIWGMLNCAVSLGAKNSLVLAVAQMYDYIQGFVLFTPVFLLAALGFPASFQTRLMYNTAFSRGISVYEFLSHNTVGTKQD